MFCFQISNTKKKKRRTKHENDEETVMLLFKNVWNYLTIGRVLLVENANCESKWKRNNDKFLSRFYFLQIKKNIKVEIKL